MIHTYFLIVMTIFAGNASMQYIPVKNEAACRVVMAHTDAMVWRNSLASGDHIPDVYMQCAPADGHINRGDMMADRAPEGMVWQVYAYRDRTGKALPLETDRLFYSALTEALCMEKIVEAEDPYSVCLLSPIVPNKSGYRVPVTR